MGAKKAAKKFKKAKTKLPKSYFGIMGKAEGNLPGQPGGGMGRAGLRRGVLG